MGALTCLDYSKMFIGGLNWETTDGRQSTESMQEAERVLIFIHRLSQGVFLAVRRSH